MKTKLVGKLLKEVDKKKPKPPKGCARCGALPIYGGGLCKKCAQSFGTW